MTFYAKLLLVMILPMAPMVGVEEPQVKSVADVTETMQAVLVALSEQNVEALQQSVGQTFAMALTEDLVAQISHQFAPILEVDPEEALHLGFLSKQMGMMHLWKVETGSGDYLLKMFFVEGQCEGFFLE